MIAKIGQSFNKNGKRGCYFTDYLFFPCRVDSLRMSPLPLWMPAKRFHLRSGVQVRIPGDADKYYQCYHCDSGKYNCKLCVRHYARMRFINHDCTDGNIHQNAKKEQCRCKKVPKRFSFQEKNTGNEHTREDHRQVNNVHWIRPSPGLDHACRYGGMYYCRNIFA